jgi:tryptophanyl-tRNA synthetase
MHDRTPSQEAALERSAVIERHILDEPNSFRVLTGDRPTGPLHVGHYLGTLANRVRLQNLGVEVIVLVADYQVLTDRPAGHDLSRTVRGLVADYLAAGIDPERSTIFAHGAVPALNELVLPFLSLVSAPSCAAIPPSRPRPRPRAHPRAGSCSPTRCTRPPTSCSAERTSSRWASTSFPIWKPHV